MRPPNLIACVPICFAVKLFNSQLLRSLNEWPTCEPPELNEPLTSSAGNRVVADLLVAAVRKLKARFVDRRRIQNRSFS